MLRLILFVFFFISHISFASVLSVDVPGGVNILDSGIKNPSTLIQVSNSDKSYPRYVKVEVFLVKPKTMDGTPEKLTKIEGIQKKSELIALPEKLVIPPNGATNVRVVYTGSPLSSDKHYKVRLIPISEVEYKGRLHEKRDASLFLSLTSTAFVSVVKASPNYQYRVDNNKVKNTGDSLLLLQDCKVCIKNNCQVYSEVRLPKGREIEIFPADKGQLRAHSENWQCKLVLPKSRSINISSND